MWSCRKFKTVFIFTKIYSVYGYKEEVVVHLLLTKCLFRQAFSSIPILFMLQGSITRSREVCDLGIFYCLDIFLCFLEIGLNYILNYIELQFKTYSFVITHYLNKVLVCTSQHEIRGRTPSLRRFRSNNEWEQGNKDF